MSYEISPDTVGTWSSAWVYETDFLLAHVSGLKIIFDEPAHDPSIPDGLRFKCKGGFVEGTVRTSRDFFMRHGAEEIDAVQSTMKLYRQAEVLYRNHPAGTSNAPERRAKA